MRFVNLRRYRMTKIENFEADLSDSQSARSVNSEFCQVDTKFCKERKKYTDLYTCYISSLNHIFLVDMDFS